MERPHRRTVRVEELGLEYGGKRSMATVSSSPLTGHTLHELAFLEPELISRHSVLPTV